jgi:hypothetical protein
MIIPSPVSNDRFRLEAIGGEPVATLALPRQHIRTAPTEAVIRLGGWYKREYSVESGRAPLGSGRWPRERSFEAREGSGSLSRRESSFCEHLATACFLIAISMTTPESVVA